MHAHEFCHCTYSSVTGAGCRLAMIAAKDCSSRRMRRLGFAAAGSVFSLPLGGDCLQCRAVRMVCEKMVIA